MKERIYTLEYPKAAHDRFKITIHAYCLISGKVNNEKIGISAISQTAGRTEQKIKEDFKTAKEFKELERKILNV
jgi:hypothetical protein